MGYKYNESITLRFSFINRTTGVAITTGEVGSDVVGAITNERFSPYPWQDITNITYKANGLWEAVIPAEHVGYQNGIVFYHTDAIIVSFNIPTSAKVVGDLNDISADDVQTACGEALTETSERLELIRP